MSAILCHRPMVEAHDYGIDSDAVSIAEEDSTAQSDDDRLSSFESLDSPGGSQTPSEMSSSPATGSTLPPPKRAKKNSTLTPPELLERQHLRTAALLKEQNEVLFEQQNELLQKENDNFKEVMAGITTSFLQGTQAMMAQLARQPVPTFGQMAQPFSFGHPLQYTQQEGTYVFAAQSQRSSQPNSQKQ
ncbi:hypothetical protein HPB49_025663 [Dermacentor silvarum]|nr:hypothetical protein HPB49_025663 [Dermacentor silvarum]